MFLTDHFAAMPDQVEEQMIRLGVKRKRGPLKYATIKRRLSTLT